MGIARLDEIRRVSDRQVCSAPQQSAGRLCCTSTNRLVNKVKPCSGSKKQGRQHLRTGRKSKNFFAQGATSSPSIFADSAKRACSTQPFLPTTHCSASWISITLT